MACGDKRKNTCGRKHNSLCVQYDGYISEHSELNDESCISIEETTEDLYHITDNIYSDIYLGNLSNSCINYDEDEYRNVKVNEAIVKHRDILCELLEKDKEVNEINISDWNLNTDCLVIDGGCRNEYSLRDVIQSLIDKVCSINCDCGNYGYGYQDNSGLGNL